MNTSLTSTVGFKPHLVIMKFLLFVALFGLVACGQAGKVRYDNYNVYQVVPHTEEHVKMLQGLEHSNLGVSFWEETSRVGHAADIMLPPHLQGQLVDDLNAQGFTVSTYIENVQRLIDEEVTGEKAMQTRLSWTAYHRYSVIQAFLHEQAALHPHARVVSMGTSYEGKDLTGIVIAKNQNKPVVFLEAGIHAREWIAGAVATFVIDQILNSPDPVIQKWSEDFEFHILPITNPDGYEFSHTNNRLWRKTRSRVSGSTCFGTDANRNWAFQWGTGGSSANPCDETFRGPTAFSEPETRSLSNYMSTLGSRIAFYLDIHSYSQFILLPYGVNIPLPEASSWLSIGRRAATALSQRFGTVFTVGNIVDMLYVASGGSCDWVKGTYPSTVKLVLVYELRDRGGYGFVLPASQILPSGQEFMDSMKSAMNDLAGLL